MLRKTLMGIVILQVLFWGFWVMGMSQQTQLTDPLRLVEFRENRKTKVITISGLRTMEARVKNNARRLGLKMHLVNIDQLFKSGKLTPSKYIANLLKTDTKFTAMIAAKPMPDKTKLALVLFLGSVLIASLIVISFLLTDGMKQTLEENKSVTPMDSDARNDKRAYRIFKYCRFLGRRIKCCGNFGGSIYWRKLRETLLTKTNKKFLRKWIAERIFDKNMAEKDEKIEEIKRWFEHPSSKEVLPVAAELQTTSEPTYPAEQLEKESKSGMSLTDLVAQQQQTLELLKKPPKIHPIKTGRRPRFLLTRRSPSTA
ncbi:MAG: hypothetical protein M1338_04750 [Patescibacteria group bacterium]|nr:hypothetical protein [Patescibacteria group bacterium]